MLGSNRCLRKRDENLFATTQQYGDALAQETQSANQAQYRNSGGAEEARTPDLFNAIEALSQLSYSPTVW